LEGFSFQAGLYVCEKEIDSMNYKKVCIDRKCEECGTHKLNEKLLPFQNFIYDNIKWVSWERTKYKNSAGKYIYYFWCFLLIFLFSLPVLIPICCLYLIYFV
jgi:hypothetical protein